MIVGRATAPGSQFGIADVSGPGPSMRPPRRQLGHHLALAATVVVMISIYPLLVGTDHRGRSDLHGTIEVAGSLFGLLAGVVLIARFYALGNRFYLFVGLAFFVNGAEDLLHGALVLSADHGWTALPASSLRQFIPGTYVTGRLAFGTLLVLAPFATRWLGSSRSPKAETLTMGTSLLLLSGAATALAFLVPLPRFIFPQKVISRPVDFASALVLAIALIAFLYRYHRDRNRLTWWLALSIGINLVGQVMMSFSKELSDVFFNIAHASKVLGYAAPLLGFSLYQVAVVARRSMALQASEEKFRAISDSALDALVMIDPEGNIAHWNPAAERMFGYRGEEIIGRRVHDTLTPIRYRQQANRGLAQYVRSGRGPAIGRTLELEALRKDGSEFPIGISVSAVRLSDQRWGLATVRDMTQRRRAEQELKDYADALESANAALEKSCRAAEDATRAKSEFLANMSHEIRTPMNGIIGMTDLLLDTKLTSEQRECTETVRHSADSLLMIINDVLDFSKIEAGQLDMEMLHFDLRRTLDEIVDIVALKAHEKGLEFICTLQPDVPPRLTGDPGRLRQILLNLINNAIKFTARGEVAVRVDLAERDVERAKLRFTVTDTGIGIPPEKQASLFESFTQADVSISRKYNGTGLGLAISKRLAELMGGQIGVQSREEIGSAFWFTASFARQSPAEEPARKPPANSRQKRILVVDDNATNRRMIGELLSSWECRHQESPDARSALEKLRKAAKDGSPFHVALLDMAMPEMGGAMLGQRIRQDAALRDTALVAMTSLGSNLDFDRLKNIGFAAHLSKPVKESALHQCLADVLTGRTSFEHPPGDHIAAGKTLPQGTLANTRILLAEDNVVNQQVALRILQKLGCRAKAVANGRDAVQALRTTSYDLVLMDVQMPEMDGLQAAGLIRDETSGVRNHHVPIIAMTAHAIKGDREKCLRAGMDDYVAKPVQPKVLAEVIRKWICGKPIRGKAHVESPRRAVGRLRPSTTTRPKRRGTEGILNVRALLKSCQQDVDFIEELVELFLGTYPSQVDDIRQAVSRRDEAALEQTAHKLKGALGSLYAPAATEAALRLEEIGHCGNMTGAENAMTALESEISRLKPALEALGRDLGRS